MSSSPKDAARAKPDSQLDNANIEAIEARKKVTSSKHGVDHDAITYPNPTDGPHKSRIANMLDPRVSHLDTSNSTSAHSSAATDTDKTGLLAPGFLGVAGRRRKF